MIRSKTFKQYLDFAYKAYQEHNTTNQEYRQEGKVPYITHPLGAALLHLADTHIPYKKREIGFKILVMHDVLEDTSLTLPRWVEPEVKKGVKEMTYFGQKSLEEKINWIKTKNHFIKLLLLYDSFWSLYEHHVGGPAERQALWKKGVLILADEVEKHYGNVRIVQIARVVANQTNW